MGYRTSTTQCIVRLLPLRNLNQEQAALCEALRREAGRCWTDMLQAHLQSRGGKWLTSVDLGKRFKGEYALHSQSIQALAQKLEANVDTARQLKKENPEAALSLSGEDIPDGGVESLGHPLGGRWAAAPLER